jgi:hypothetical protein
MVRWTDECLVQISQQSASALKAVMLPHVYRHLTDELADIDVTLTLSVS